MEVINLHSMSKRTVVRWRERDGAVRRRSFRDVRVARLFAAQLGCRRQIDELLEAIALVEAGGN